MPTETSLKAFQRMRETGDLNKQEQAMREAYEDHAPCTRQELEEYTDFKINQVTGRTKGLLEKNAVIIVGEKIGATGYAQEVIGLPGHTKHRYTYCDNCRENRVILNGIHTWKCGCNTINHEEVNPQ